MGVPPRTTAAQPGALTRGQGPRRRGEKEACSLCCPPGQVPGMLSCDRARRGKLAGLIPALPAQGPRASWDCSATALCDHSGPAWKAGRMSSPLPGPWKSSSLSLRLARVPAPPPPSRGLCSSTGGPHAGPLWQRVPAHPGRPARGGAGTAVRRPASCFPAPQPGRKAR